MAGARYTVVCVLATALLLAGCGEASAPVARSADCVILLHGLARTRQSMMRMQQMLARSGYHVANIDYPSRDHKIGVLAPLAVEAGLRRCREIADYSAVHFVTHSLGGILVRAYLANHTIDKLGRVVMLAPPNQGSQAVDAMEQIPGFDWLNGPAGYQLGKGAASVPLSLGAADFEVAVIAGNRSIDPLTSAILDDPDDGKVSVSDTRLDGMRDFVVVPVSHAMIMQDGEVFELVRNYLAHGSFHPGIAYPAGGSEATVKVAMLTSEGEIGIDLYLDKAPLTAGNFLKLVDGGHLDGGSFYRVVTFENDHGQPKIEVIQGGLGDERESPVPPIGHETTEQTGIAHTDGVISMARGDVGTASSEFFICVGDQPGLDYGAMRNPDGQGFAAFGKVVTGMDVVRRINRLAADAPTASEYTKGQMLAEPVTIISVRRTD